MKALMEHIKIKEYLKGSVICKKDQKITNGYLIIAGAVYATDKDLNSEYANDDFYSGDGVAVEEMIRRQGPHE